MKLLQLYENSVSGICTKIFFCNQLLVWEVPLQFTCTLAHYPHVIFIQCRIILIKGRELCEEWKVNNTIFPLPENAELINKVHERLAMLVLEDL